MVFVVKAFWVFAMAAFHFTIVPGCIRPNQFVPDMQLSGSGLEGRQHLNALSGVICSYGFG
jgi:hypothetical protein